MGEMFSAAAFAGLPNISGVARRSRNLEELRGMVEESWGSGRTPRRRKTQGNADRRGEKKYDMCDRFSQKPSWHDRSLRMSGNRELMQFAIAHPREALPPLHHQRVNHPNEMTRSLFFPRMTLKSVLNPNSHSSDRTKTLENDSTQTAPSANFRSKSNRKP